MSDPGFEAKPVGASLGLIAAAGLTPLLVAREARATGWCVHAFATEESFDLTGEVDRVIHIRLGEAMEILSYLIRERIGALVLAGKLSKVRLFESPLPDPVGVGALDWGDRTLLEHAVTLLETQGIRLLDQRQFLGPWLAKAGPLTSRRPSASQEAEIERGFTLARQLARLGVGQTVVLKRGVVLAAEAVEATDEAISRGCRLGGPGAVVVKAVAEDHDFRFDVHAIGPRTIEALADGQAAVLAVEASRALVLEPELTISRAERLGLCLVGREDERHA